MDRAIKEILMIIEDIGAPGTTSILSGASMAQDESDSPANMSYATDKIGYGVETQPEEPEFSELELRLAKRFLELIGGAERARDLIDKCNDCEECLGLVSDEDQIEQISHMVPTDADLPTMDANMSPLYNPGANAGPYSAY